MRWPDAVEGLAGGLGLNLQESASNLNSDMPPLGQRNGPVQMVSRPPPAPAGPVFWRSPFLLCTFRGSSCSVSLLESSLGPIAARDDPVL